MRSKLTVRSVEAVQLAKKDVIIWDTEVPGFGCKVTPKGRRSYFLFYRTHDGQQRKPAIGVHGVLKPEAARAIAKEWLGEVAKGNDPSLTRKVARKAPTVGELCEQYLAEYARPRKKASSVDNDQRIIEQHIKPALGSRKVAAIARADIAALHSRMKARSA